MEQELSIVMTFAMDGECSWEVHANLSSLAVLSLSGQAMFFPAARKHFKVGHPSQVVVTFCYVVEAFEFHNAAAAVSTLCFCCKC